MSERELELVEVGGNAFRDFAGPDADLKQADAIVAARIITLQEDHTRTVRVARDATGFAATDVSCIRSTSPGRFTLVRLMEILVALAERTRVAVRIDPRSTGMSGSPLPGRAARSRYSARAIRNPFALNRTSGVLLSRVEDRTPPGPSSQEPPRSTRRPQLPPSVHAPPSSGAPS